MQKTKNFKVIIYLKLVKSLTFNKNLELTFNDYQKAQADYYNHVRMLENFRQDPNNAVIDYYAEIYEDLSTTTGVENAKEYISAIIGSVHFGK